MSEERRPPVPAPQADPTPTADTPRDGTPAFGDTDEIPIVLDPDTIPPAGPSPDHASEYVPPRALPKPVDHKTIENIPVHISPDAESDPRRRADTQKAMRVIKREEAQRQLMLMGVDATVSTPDARPSQASMSDADGSGKSRSGLFIGGAIVLLVLVALGFIAFKMVVGDPDPDAATTSPTSTAGGASPAKPAPAPAPAPTRTPAASAKAPLAAPTPAPTPAASAAPATTPSTPTKRKPRPTSDEPKPINE